MEMSFNWTAELLVSSVMFETQLLHVMLPSLLGHVVGGVDIDLDNKITLDYIIMTCPLTSWINKQSWMCYRRAVGMVSGSLRICACIFSFKARPEVAWAELLDLENRNIGILFRAEVGNFFFFWAASFPLQSRISHFSCVCRPHLPAYRPLIKVRPWKM